MITLMCAVSILPIGIIAYLYSKRLAHPAVIMSSVWIAVFLLLSIFSDLYYSLDPLPLAIITLGVIAYCMCAFLADTVGRKACSRQFSIKIDAGASAILLIVSWLTLPLYVQQQLQLAGGDGSILHQIRKNSLDNLGGENLITNMVLVSIFVSVIYITKYIVKKSRMNLLLYILAFVTAVGYSALTGSKLPILSLFISNGLVIILLSGRSQVFYAFGILVATLSIFVTGLYLVNYAGISSYGTPEKLVSSALDYFLGGTAAFASSYDTVLQFNNSQTIQNAFSSVPRKIGFDVATLPIHYPYVYIFKDRITNVYTVFFPLIKEYSLLGAMIVMAIFGFFHGFLFKFSYLRTEYFISYVIIMSSAVSVIFGDPFLYGAFTNLKYALIAYVYYLLSNLFNRIRESKAKTEGPSNVSNRMRSN